MNPIATARRFFQTNQSAAAISNAAIAAELRALADRLETESNVAAIGAVLALQLSDTQFEAVRVGNPVPNVRDGILITDHEVRPVRVEYE